MGFSLEVRAASRAAPRSRPVRGRRPAGHRRAARPPPARALGAASASRRRSGARSCAGPSRFLMDEPLANLDAQLRLATRASIASLQRELGTTILYVTHDQGEAMSLGERVAVMRSGRARAGGRAAGALQPARDAVRGLLPRLAADEPVARPPRRGGRPHRRRRRPQRLALPDAVLARLPGLRGHRRRPPDPRPAPRVFSTTARGRQRRAQLPVAFVESLGSHLLVHLEAEGAGLQLADVRPGGSAIGHRRRSPPDVDAHRLPAAPRARSGRASACGCPSTSSARTSSTPATQFALG